MVVNGNQVCAVFAVLAIGSGCIRTPGVEAPGTGGESNSVLAAIDGMRDDDYEREEISYWLECESGTRVKADKNPSKADDKVRFPGKKIKAGDTCAMEVRAKPTDDLIWYSKPETPGLYYGSDKAVVEKNGDKLSLTLTLYRTYGEDIAGFTAKLYVSFATEDGQTAPDQEKVSGNLVCSDEDSPHPGSYEGTGDATGYFLFENLDARKMNGQSCSKVVALVDNKEAFAADLTSVEFAGPKKGDVIEFKGDDDQPFILKAQEATSDIDVVTIAGGLCLEYSAEDNQCLDRRRIEMPYPENHFFVRVVGKSDLGEGETAEMWVTLKDVNTSRGFSKSELTVDMLNQDLNPDAEDEDAGVELDYFSLALQPDFKDPTGLDFDEHRLKKQDLKGTIVLDLKTFWIYGYKQIEESELATYDSARWLASILATKDDEEDKTFFVESSDLDTPQAGSPAEPKYFDFDEFLTNVGSTDEKKWQILALKDEAMAPAECKATKDFYLKDLSRLVSGIDLEEDAIIKEFKKKCVVGSDAFDADLADDGWDAALTYYVLEFYQL